MSRNLHSIARKILYFLIFFFITVLAIITMAFTYAEIQDISKIILTISIIGAAIVSFVWLKKEMMLLSKTLEKESLLKRLSQKKVHYLEQLIESANDIIMTIDTSACIMKFNKGAEFHFGYGQKEMIGRPLSFLFTVPARCREILELLRISNSVVNEEVAMKTKDGETRWVTLSMAEVKYENISLNGYVITAKDITEIKQMELELRRKNDQLGLLAITDSLTELYNVRHFYDQIKKELRRLSRNPSRNLSLILIDIDHFKPLNDTEGHQMGDHVLVSLSEVIRACIRKDIDSAYRYGGDEFVIILPDADKTQAMAVSERIQKQFSAFKFGITSLSIGITTARDGDSQETIVKRADDAMYHSKRNGKGCISIE